LALFRKNAFFGIDEMGRARPGGEVEKYRHSAIDKRERERERERGDLKKIK